MKLKIGLEVYIKKDSNLDIKGLKVSILNIIGKMIYVLPITNSEIVEAKWIKSSEVDNTYCPSCNEKLDEGFCYNGSCENCNYPF